MGWRRGGGGASDPTAAAAADGGGRGPTLFFISRLALADLVSSGCGGRWDWVELGQEVEGDTKLFLSGGGGATRVGFHLLLPLLMFLGMPGGEENSPSLITLLPPLPVLLPPPLPFHPPPLHPSWSSPELLPTA